jgi:type IV pilus assembly protein PilC
MPNFTFKGRNRQGEIIAGERVAENRGALALALRREEILLTEAAEKKGGSSFNFDFGGNASAKDLAVFTRQFSVMIDAGVPLVQCLEILGEQQDKKKFKAVIQSVQKEVESGSNLAAAMKTHYKVFESKTL